MPRDRCDWQKRFLRVPYCSILYKGVQDPILMMKAPILNDIMVYKLLWKVAALRIWTDIALTGGSSPVDSKPIRVSKYVY